MQNPATADGQKLDRGMGLAGALSANILNMVGIGPFITIPLALAAMGGPQAMLGWILGAILCLCDGMVWAELGSALPRSGGPYHYLLQAFGPRSWGRILSFLFLWQLLLIGPISIAAGAVGFGQYANFLAPHLQHAHLVMIAMAVCLLNTALLYRSIRSISMVSIVITVAVLGTCLWIVISGLVHFNSAIAFNFPSGAFHLSRPFWLGLGSATLIAVYDYGGYNNVCLIGEEVRAPRKTIPRAVIYSIILIALLYLAMNLSIIGTVPWQQGLHSKAIVADYMQTIYGRWGGLAGRLPDSGRQLGIGFRHYSRLLARTLYRGGGGAFFQAVRPLASNRQVSHHLPSVHGRALGGGVPVLAGGSDFGPDRHSDHVSVRGAVHRGHFAAPKFHRAGWRISNAALSLCRRLSPWRDGSISLSAAIPGILPSAWPWQRPA